MDKENNKNKTHEYELAERCIELNKTPILLDEVYAFLTDDHLIAPICIKNGQPLTIICRSHYMDGQIDNIYDKDPVHWSTPMVVDVTWIQDHLIIESRHYIFSTLDFSNEYRKMLSDKKPITYK